jgi:hypothetical protein
MGNNVVLQIYDAAGKLMYENNVSSTTPGQVINIPLQKFAKGIYTLKINSTAGVKEQRILEE